MTKPLNKIKIGEAFQFEIGGAVFVKCRGGFRLGIGGQLHSCAPHQIVIQYHPDAKLKELLK